MSYVISMACSVYRKVGHPVVFTYSISYQRSSAELFIKDRSITSTTATCDAETYCCTVLYLAVF